MLTFVLGTEVLVGVARLLLQLVLGERVGVRVGSSVSVRVLQRPLVARRLRLLLRAVADRLLGPEGRQ